MIHLWYKRFQIICADVTQPNLPLARGAMQHDSKNANLWVLLEVFFKSRCGHEFNLVLIVLPILRFPVMISGTNGL